MIRPSIDLRTSQHLTLTPRLQQSVKLLQLSSVELAQELQQALANNPFLEEDEVSSQAAEPLDRLAGGELPQTGETALRSDVFDSPGLTTEHVERIESAAPGDDERDFAEPAAYDDRERLSESLAEAPRRERADDGDEFNQTVDWQAVQPNLQQQLQRALHHYHLGERDRLLVELVVESLDEDGYLRDDLAALAATLGLSPPATDVELSMALKLVQQMDAPGIGARDLTECLRLQLHALDLLKDTESALEEAATVQLARQLIDGHLPGLARREYAEMERTLGCDATQLRRAFQLIRSLDPKPGLRYGNTRVAYVTADVIVRKIKGTWCVMTNPAVLPRARLNQTYAAMFRQAQCQDRAPLAQELQEARWLIRNVEQRFSTIQRVAEAIVAHQRNFFEYGEAALKPYGLSECAEALDLHESTISRATSNKYMATPRGIIEFKHFFSRELATESGGTCSAAAVRALIKGMIEAEDGNAPLSDVALTRLLANHGVVVARRTVTKYRDQLHLPPADLRRRI